MIRDLHRLGGSRDEIERVLEIFYFFPGTRVLPDKKK